MIACYCQYLYCVILPPTQFLQLSPRLEPSIVSMRVVFFLIVCLFAFEILTPLLTIPHLPTPTPSKRQQKAGCIV